MRSGQNGALVNRGLSLAQILLLKLLPEQAALSQQLLVAADKQLRLRDAVVASLLQVKAMLMLLHVAQNVTLLLRRQLLLLLLEKAIGFIFAAAKQIA